MAKEIGSAGPGRTRAGSTAGPLATVRAGEWWTYKLVPLLGIFYLTVLQSGGSLMERWPNLLLLLGALASGAAFVSLLNDWSDRDEDAAAGKRNRLAGRSRVFAASAIGVSLLTGAAIGFLLPPDPIVLSTYGAAWLAFLCYSVPPLRFKARGGWGLLADAAGSSLFPAILAARLAGAEDIAWLALVAAFALAFGVRGIAWHQIGDEAADRKAGVSTYVVRRGRATTARIVHLLAVPVELGALAALLIWTASPAPAVAMALYAAVVALRHDNFRETPTFVVPHRRNHLLGVGFYDLWLPLALLCGLAARHPPDAIVLLVHLILFPGPLLALVADGQAAWRCHRARVAHRGR